MTFRSGAICECGSDIWEDDLDKGEVKCANCCRKRQFRRRKRGTGRTASQQKVIDQVLAKIADRHHVADLEIEDLDWGACSLSVRAAYREDLTTSLADDRYHVLIGRRGGILRLARHSFGVASREAKGPRALNWIF